MSTSNPVSSVKPVHFYDLYGGRQTCCGSTVPGPEVAKRITNTLESVTCKRCKERIHGKQ